MANKRMFSNVVIDSDLFLEMPISSQALYFHLGMRCDDDGFVSNSKKIIKMCNCSGDDLGVLILKGFVLSFDNNIFVIKDHKINNYIPKDRYKETIHTDEKALLQTLESGSYTKCMTECIQAVFVDKSREDKIRIDKSKYGEFQNVLLSDIEIEKLKEKFTDYEDKIYVLSLYLENNKKKKYDSHYATILNWDRRDKKDKPKEKEWNVL